MTKSKWPLQLIKLDHYSAFYSDKFYKIHYSDKALTSAYKVVKILREYLSFDSAIDIGCGVGQVLKACSETGTSIIRGVDGPWVKKELLMIPSECFSQYDLSQPNLREKIPEKNFDLTISSEVAEHIDPQDTETYMDNLTSFSNVILFSAAIPGQGGVHHVNEQWPSYWIKKFSARGFVPVDCIRPIIWDDDEIRTDYRQNLMLFVKEDKLENYPAIKSEAKRKTIDLIHPLTHASKMKLSNKGFFQLCRIIFTSLFYLIPAFVRGVKRRLFA